MSENGGEPAVLWSQEGGLGRITLNRPDSLNSWNIALGKDLNRILQGEAADPSVRAVLLTGAGRSFSSGADLKSTAEVEVADDGMPDIGSRLRNLYNPVITGVRELEKPVIASVQGGAVGIGCSLALACDLIVAGEDAYFLMAFANIGLMPDGGATLTLPARIGKARATELAMLAEKLPAPQALEWGLINAVHAPDQLAAEAEALAERLADGPTRAYAAAKNAINRSVYSGLAEQLELEATEQHQLFRTQDVVEGGMAFIQKRDPAFTGA